MWLGCGFCILMRADHSGATINGCEDVLQQGTTLQFDDLWV